MVIQLPEILDVPEKLYPFIFDFDKYNYHLLEGGRGGGKSHGVARFILYLSEQRRLRICCGREIQKTIEESVKAVFENLINEYNLNFTIKSDRLIHNVTGTVIFFVGFREQGRVNIKGLEGIDILWIDEAQAITKPTLDYIIPTIRKVNSRVIFTMNRFVRNDPVYKFCVGREDALHITINYYDNKFLSQKQRNEAEILKNKNFSEFEHIWLGKPLAQASDYLIPSSKIDEAQNLVFNNDKHPENKVMSVDLSGSGGDLCVAKLFTQQSLTGWLEAQTITWSQPDTDITKGKIINLYGLWQPDILIIDADGLGYPIYVSVKKSIQNAIGFRGAGSSKTLSTGNQRADGYLATKEFIDNGWLKLTCENSIRQLEYIKRVYKPSGLIFIQDKKDIRKEQSESPDFADTVMMAVYAIVYHSHLFKSKNNHQQGSAQIQNDFNPFE